MRNGILFVLLVSTLMACNDDKSAGQKLDEITKETDSVLKEAGDSVKTRFQRFKLKQKLKAVKDSLDNKL